MKDIPFFSIIIPTRNRAVYLERAIRCLLQQSFVNFEIIICDNDSSDKTNESVLKFSDSRIIYIKNKSDIGWIKNIENGISNANGKYILLHGDDDFILHDDVLDNTHKLIDESGYGYIRLNYIRQSRNEKKLINYFKNIFTDASLFSNSSNEKIISFLSSSEPFFITGILFKNIKNEDTTMINSELAPWFKYIFTVTKRYGGYVVSRYCFVASWSRNNGSYYLITNGQFQFESYFKEVCKLVSKNYYRLFLESQLNIVIILLPAAKLYTNYKNLYFYAKRIMYLAPKYKKAIKFWVYFIIAFIAPKLLLSWYRSYRENKTKGYKIDYVEKIMERIIYLNSW